MTRARDLLGAARVVPLIAPVTFGDGIAACEAVAAAGLGVVEIALRSQAALSVLAAATEMPGLTAVAGTVRSPADVRSAIEHGARLLIGPGDGPGVADEAARLGVPWIPGVATPTELGAALARGCGIVKLFPARVLGGLAMLDALHSVYPEAAFLVSGGVTLADVGEYLAHPAVAAVSGSWIAPDAPGPSARTLAGVAAVVGPAPR